MKIRLDKYISRLKTSAVIGAVGTALAFSGANVSADVIVPGQLINIDWNGNGGGPVGNPGTFDGDLTNGTFTADGVNFVDSDAANNDFWNGVADAEGVAGSISGLFDTANSSVDGVTVSWGAFGGTYNNYNNRGADLTLGANADGLVENPGTSIDITISGLVDGEAYDITAIGAFRASRYTIDGSSETILQYNTVPVAGVSTTSNFAEFNSVVATGGEIVITVDSGVGGAFDIGGLQITGNFTAVPEPSSIAILGSASLLGLLRRRRKNA